MLVKPMSNAKNTKPGRRKSGGPAWVSRAVIANFFGVSVNAFDEYKRPHIDRKFIKRDGRRLLFNVRGAVECYAAYEARQAAANEANSGVSAERENWLMENEIERVKIGHLKRLELEGRLLPRHQVHRLFMSAARLLRQCAATLRRRYGPEAQQLFDAELVRVQTEVEASLVNSDAGKGITLADNGGGDRSSN